MPRVARNSAKSGFLVKEQWPVATESPPVPAQSICALAQAASSNAGHSSAEPRP